MKAGVGVVGAVGMGVEGEGHKVGVLPAVFVHVAAHYQGVEGHERQALIAFPFGVGGGGQLGGDLIGGGVGHFFDRHGQSGIHRTGSHGHYAGAEGGAARRTGGLQAQPLGIAHADPIGDVAAQVLLEVGGARHHVAGVDCVHAAYARILQGGQGRIPGQFAQGFIPLFFDFGLSNS